MKISKIAKITILIIAIMLLFAVMKLNIFFTANITNNTSEVVKLNNTGLLNFTLVVLFATLIYILALLIEKINKKISKKKN